MSARKMNREIWKTEKAKAERYERHADESHDAMHRAFAKGWSTEGYRMMIRRYERMAAECREEMKRFEAYGI